MKKELSIVMEPMIRVYQHHAYCLGILQMKSDGVLWIFNNYIQIYCTKENGIDTINYCMDFVTHQPIFNREYLSDELLKEMNVNPLDYIKKALNHNKYVLACVDDFYIDCRYLYQKEHFIHDIIIYGYDDNKNELNIAGYNKNSVYSASILSYDNFLLSQPQYMELISLKENTEFVIDLDSILLEVMKYLNQVNTSMIGDWKRENLLFGMDVHAEILKEYKNTMLNKENCNINPIYFVMEHRNCMKERMVYIDNHYAIDLAEIITQYDKIVEKSISLINIVLKYNFVLDSKYSNRFARLYEETLAMEIKSLNDFVKKLKEYIKHSDMC